MLLDQKVIQGILEQQVLKVIQGSKDQLVTKVLPDFKVLKESKVKLVY